MVIAREIKRGILSLTAIDWSRRLFDELVPLPEGTSYNAYVVQGSEKTALIDTVHQTMAEDLITSLKCAGITKIDYIVSNHAEPDHSGSIPAVLAAFPEARMLANPKCRTLLTNSFELPPEAFILLKDNETLSLGDRTLRFLWTPWVHWPDTTLTYLEEDRILFSCDFLGAHLATSDLYAIDTGRMEQAARLYYAEIMMPYRQHVKKHLQRLRDFDIDLIAPGHGPIHGKPDFILDLYRQWSADETREEVVIPYLSMYNSTSRMVDFLVGTLIHHGVKVMPFNVVDLDTGRFASALVEASTLVFASPTVLDGPHPSMVSAAYLVNALKAKASFAAIIGSCGWGTAMPENLRAFLPNLNAAWFHPVITSGAPKDEDYAALAALAEHIVEANRTGTMRHAWTEDEQTA